jgi:HAD superfamily hydrolase (TIGR01509 family)
MTTAILDIDGTLVDTNYQHALAWYRAFRAHEIVLPVWRIHRHIGMGGDQVVSALTDERTEKELGDQIRAAEKDLYFELIDEIEPMDSARELIEQLRDRGHKVILASSAKPEEVERYLDLLDARELANAWTSSGDVDATKPHPDLVETALAQADEPPQEAVMVGDTPWDVQAARKAGVETVAVLTGGFAVEELTESGAVAVFQSVAELCQHLEGTRLG